MIHSTDPHADQIISYALFQSILSARKPSSELVFFCIGTPHVCGDALGPYVGSRLEYLNLPKFTVYGTWKNPIHALNLSQQWEYAKKKHPDSCFIAIDASFGSKIHLGNIFVENRPVYPGQGVGKKLPPIGDISITGIVCQNSLLRHKQLKSTPFPQIKQQGEIILNSIFQTWFYLITLLP